jgi:hypothetical protein
MSIDTLHQGFQLQFWDARKRAYVPASSFETDGSACERLKQRGRNEFSAWRVCGVHHALKVPPLRRKALTGAGRTVEAVQRDYLRWAKARGLKHIHAYSTRPLALDAPGDHYCAADGNMRTVRATRCIYHGDIEWLTPAQQFAVVESQDGDLQQIAA